MQRRLFVGSLCVGSALPLAVLLTAAQAHRTVSGALRPLAAPQAPTAATTCNSTNLAGGLGWDSATAWVGNSVPQIASGWAGSLFMGNDNAFFASSSAAFRFTNVTLDATALVTRATLTLDGGSVAFTPGGTWNTLLAGDAGSGADFSGLTRDAFLARFDLASRVNWLAPDIGASRPTESPDIAAIINARLQDPTWRSGESIVVGVLNNRTYGRAEVGVVKSAHSAVLHLEWSVGSAPHAAACIDDSDGDGYSDVQELLLGKDPSAYCAIMRADANDDGAVNGLDLGWLAAYYTQSVPPTPPRVDQNGDGTVNGLDLGWIALSYTENVTRCP